MQFDLFISYAWTSNMHREWVRLLASHLHAIGFAVGIDEKVNYGESLGGFMRKIKESRHVLMIADENYAFRADNMPDSGLQLSVEFCMTSLIPNLTIGLHHFWSGIPREYCQSGFQKGI